MNTYTVFCQDADGTGTIWISSIEADDVEHAKTVGRNQCAEEWGREDPHEVHVLGVAEGNVRIAFWEDIND